ncbi:MAG TPA: DUF4912 domain-containing protein [Chthoniobacterales bacterium]
MAHDRSTILEDAGVFVSQSPKPTPFRLSKQPMVAGPGQPPIEEEPVVDLVKEFAPATIYDDLGELPATYGSGTIFLAARDPHWLFVYWDIDLEAISPEMLLDGESAFYLKVFKAGGELVDQIRVNTEARNWYFPVKEAGVEYFVELGYNDMTCQWSALGRSNEVFSPADAFSEGIAEFATLPFHLSFQKIIDLIGEEIPPGETLAGALARLQKSTDPTLRSLASTWTPEQRQLLEALVGPELVAQVTLGSANVDQIFRERLTEILSSPGASEFSFLQGASSEVLAALGSSLSSEIISSWGKAAGLGVSSLESGKAFGSEVTSSWAGASFGAAGVAAGAWGPTSAGASWLTGVSSAETSSWQAAVLSGVSSWLAGLASGSWESAGFALGSWGAAAGASSSAAGAFGSASSWPGAGGASLGGSSGLSSWEASHGGESSGLSSWEASHGGGSSGLSSWEVSHGGGSSWSGSSWPSSIVDAAWGSSWSRGASGSGEGLLDVQAEVIFHGKVHPRASVWVDGKKVTPAPDGSFHFHLNLPTSGFDIPIVASLADGSEVQSAKLSWK